MYNKERKISVPDEVTRHPAWVRLEDQLDWYNSKSNTAQSRYKQLKTLQIALAVAIPVVAHFDTVLAPWITSSFGAVIATLEGIQHMNQYSTLWITYRATTEHLKHEKYLFLSLAGPYKGLEKSEERLILLAERVEEHVSAEHANWFHELRRTTTKASPAR